MLQLKNSTPFDAAFFVFPDVEGVDTLFVAVKATFEFGAAGVAIASKQRPIALADEYLGEPARSGLKYPNEAHIAKPASDIALLGSVYAPGGRPVPRFDARMRVGRLEKRLRVLGERVWRRGLYGLTATTPLSVSRLPVVWERAFGGRDEVISGPTSVESRNPIGRGFPGRRGLEEMERQPLPNFELPDSPLKLPVVQFHARVRIHGETQKLLLALETLLLEPDDGRFCLTWRASVSCDKMALKVETIELAMERLDGVVS